MESAIRSEQVGWMMRLHDVIESFDRVSDQTRYFIDIELL